MFTNEKDSLLKNEQTSYSSSDEGGGISVKKPSVNSEETRCILDNGDNIYGDDDDDDGNLLFFEFFHL